MMQAMMAYRGEKEGIENWRIGPHIAVRESNNRRKNVDRAEDRNQVEIEQADDTQSDQYQLNWVTNIALHRIELGQMMMRRMC